MDKSLINQISDLLSQINEDTVYFRYDSAAFASCQLKHWQAKTFVNNKLRTKNHNALFLEHLDKLRVAIERNLEISLVDVLLDCFGDYVVPSIMSKKRYQIITPLYSPISVSMEDIVRCLILWCIATDISCAIDKLESFSNNDPLKYKEYMVIEGLNISKNYNFADFEIMPSNENLGVIPESLLKQLGYPFWPDRTLLVSENEFKRVIEKPKVVTEDEYSKMLENDPGLPYISDRKTGKIFTYDKRSFNTEKKGSLRIDILCFAFSLYLKTPISYSWHFLSLDENHLLYLLPEAEFHSTGGSIDYVLGRTNKISITDNDMAAIKHIYEQTVAIDSIGSEESKDFMDCVKLFMDIQTLPMRLDYNRVPMLAISFETSIEKSVGTNRITDTLTSFISSVQINGKPLTEFYDIRNAFVHAIAQRKGRLRHIQNNEQADEIVEETIDILREMLKKCIDEQILPSVDEGQRSISGN
ncbi:MAG: hypothetical protein OXI63_01895 [Candidatus Poribacteria bacterium]|nr:hypothetical protein [Candidatus Poribacteria bacterium]